NLHPVVDKRIETLPISREKEALLTCTRPTFLPPKSKREEKKHLREYEKLIRGSLEVDRKVQRKKYKQVNSKAKHLTNSVEQWDKAILPHFDTAIRDPRTRALWWSGLPSRVRGRVWATCIGNALSVTPDTFRVAYEKAVALEARLLRPPTGSSETEDQLLTSEHFLQLRQSMYSTFAELRIFQPGGPLHECLLQVLMAYLYYRQDVGFVPGTSYIAGLLLLNLTPAQSFVTLVNLLNRALPLALVTRDEAVLNRFLGTFMIRFQEKLPRLYRHLHEELRLSPVRYLLPMLYSLFAEQAPVDVTSRIWDIYFFEGDLFLMRVALAIMVQLEHALY
ncbi:rab-GTPase-TBC domain-domain-containing protein, partial [Protomyces lactucae-debilis]